MRKLRIVNTLLLFLLATNLIGQARKNDKPNVIFILIDDLGWRDLACQGSKTYETPNVDKLASESMRFTEAYACHPRCVPSRFGIMTGKYPAHGGVPADREHLKASENTFARFIKQSGYRSCYIGKWHLGDGATGPVAMGFDTSIAAGAAGSPRNYFAPYNATYDKPWKERKAPIPGLDNAPKGQYLNDRLTTEAIKFIDKNKQGPFFLMMAHYAVHEPLQAPDSVVNFFQNKINGIQWPDGPAYIPEGTGREKMRQDNAVYAAMVQNMDWNIGRILNYLKENGLDKNTIIIFTSDHGGLSNDGFRKRNLATSNAPLRAGKGWLYEGGTRVPLFIKWPGVTKAQTDSTNTVIGIDFYPTIAELMTGKKVKSDGRSLLPLLLGEEPEKRQAIFWYSPKARPKSTGDSNSIAIRAGNYKLIEWYETGRIEMYNLKEDISEQHNIANKETLKKDELLRLLNAWRKKYKLN